MADEVGFIAILLEETKDAVTSPPLPTTFISGIFRHTKPIHHLQCRQLAIHLTSLHAYEL